MLGKLCEISCMSPILLEWKELGEGKEEVGTRLEEWGILGAKCTEAPMVGVGARPQAWPLSWDRHSWPGAVEVGMDGTWGPFFKA